MACEHRAHAAQQLLGVLALDDVAVGAGRECARHDLGLEVAGEHQHLACERRIGLDRRGDLDAALARQLEIEELGGRAASVPRPAPG